ncbi:hypothetical protein [Helicobacter suis]|uniref:hypothetical protein n=1 Tax=Helicobacter suis TaxID=104628 RepID=UPI0013D0BA44|nr:hypothetical protein [Helicobacter suis]
MHNLHNLLTIQVQQVQALKQDKEALNNADTLWNHDMPYILNQLLNDPTLLKAMSTNNLEKILEYIVTTLAPALDKPEKVKKLVMEIVKEVEARSKDNPSGYHK